MPSSSEIIQRLERILTDYITMGANMGLTVSTLDLLRVLDRVIAVEEGEEVADWSFTDPLESFLEGLCEELLDHPNTVSEVVNLPDGSTGYRSLNRETWRSTLRQLRENLEKAAGI